MAVGVGARARVPTNRVNAAPIVSPGISSRPLGSATQEELESESEYLPRLYFYKVSFTINLLPKPFGVPFRVWFPLELEHCCVPLLGFQIRVRLQ